MYGLYWTFNAWLKSSDVVMLDFVVPITPIDVTLSDVSRPTTLASSLVLILTQH